jgi:hypothetical protein
VFLETKKSLYKRKTQNRMKRIHLFEFEDQSWFPDWIRVRMTRMIVVVHKFFGTSDTLAELIADVLKRTNTTNIIDLCSGSGGPMLEVVDKLKDDYKLPDTSIMMTDLYPNKKLAQQLNSDGKAYTQYNTQPVDATQLSEEQKGLRTMICSFHHMKPDIAKAILRDAKEAHQPICIYEISDNSMPPAWLWWIGLPFNFIFALFVSAAVRPMNWQQIIFTYLIPVIPLCFAWDGAVSNIRTYTLSDMDQLLEGLHAENYTWEKGTIKGKGGNKLYLKGIPT